MMMTMALISVSSSVFFIVVSTYPVFCLEKKHETVDLGTGKARAFTVNNVISLINNFRFPFHRFALPHLTVRSGWVLCVETFFSFS